MRLIDEADARRRIVAFATGLHSEVLPIDAVLMLLTQVQTIDAVPVVHGRRDVERGAERDPKRLFVRIVCSNCGLKTGQKSNYCPNCGARMGKEDT